MDGRGEADQATYSHGLLESHGRGFWNPPVTEEEQKVNQNIERSVPNNPHPEVEMTARRHEGLCFFVSFNCLHPSGSKFVIVAQKVEASVNFRRCLHVSNALNPSCRHVINIPRTRTDE